MARHQNNHAPFAAPYSPIIERDSGGCGCFRRFCFGWDDCGSRRYLLQEGGGDVHREEEEAWVVAQIKKLKQSSELVAGPKWKNFIRRIGRLCRRKKQAPPPFHYSPESYALNFAGDHQDQAEEEGNLTYSFSARFAPRVFDRQ